MPKGIPNGPELIELFTLKVCVVETPDFGSGGGSAAGFNGLSFFFLLFSEFLDSRSMDLRKVWLIL